MIRGGATTCQKCQHPTSCEGHTCARIRGDIIQPCDQLTPCHLMEGRAVGLWIAKKKLTETLIQLTTPSLSSHFKWCFLLLMEGFPSRQCLGHVFAITQLICSNVTHFEKKPLDHMKPQLNTEGNRLSFHPYRFVRHDAWPPCALGVFSKEVQNQKQDIGN